MKRSDFFTRLRGGRRIVCVICRTTVRLVQRCVRYIDNFSSGNRCALSLFQKSFDVFLPAFGKRLCRVFCP
ncbi:hypothetical protein N665_0493s0035 [Sinapis alba]|nr:hypothetical protein N665_0493s0035 [Sinapis alba]